MKKGIFKHVGGKNGLLGAELAALLPQVPPDVYIEPYGGSFGLAIQSDYNPDKILMIHNEYDIRVHSIFKAVTTYPEETLNAVYSLLEKFDCGKFTLDYFKYVFDLYDRTGIMLFKDDIFRGAAAWILKSITCHGNCRSLVRSESDDPKEKLEKYFERREETALDLKGVIALNRDAMDILKEIKNSGRSHDMKIFLYIDAPYSHSGKRTTSGNLYNKDISKDDKEIVELAEILVEINQCTDCKMMVSEYDSPIYNSILTEENGWHKVKVCDMPKRAYFSLNGECKPIETEYVWLNYDR